MSIWMPGQPEPKPEPKKSSMEVLADCWNREMDKAEEQYVRDIIALTPPEELERVLDHAGVDFEWTDRAKGQFKWRVRR